MNKFQKIGIFFVRIIAVICVLFGINGFVYSLLLLISKSLQFGEKTGEQGLVSGSFYFIIGVLLFVFSKPLGKAIGHGLD